MVVGTVRPSRRIPDLEILQRETRSWKRRVNSAQVRIDWKSDRRAARKKLGYKRYTSKRSWTWLSEAVCSRRPRKPASCRLAPR